MSITIIFSCKTVAIECFTDHLPISDAVGTSYTGPLQFLITSAKTFLSCCATDLSNLIAVKDKHVEMMQFQGHFHTMFCCDDCTRLEINQTHRGKNIMKHCEILPDEKLILIAALY